MKTQVETEAAVCEHLARFAQEYQSTNEELTTSKEEMQSLNEELQTVNQELQAKVDDLTQANNDMKNLLESRIKKHVETIRKAESKPSA